MKTFKPTISLVKNSRGCYIIDTVKGCKICEVRPKGCYDDCYARNIAFRYGLDFINPIKREFYEDRVQLLFPDFIDSRHIDRLIKEVKEIDMPFVRIGEMGDPSEDWAHTLNVCGVLAEAGKPIVIITKHWKSIPDELLEGMKMLNLYINTSVSALDSEHEIQHRLAQYERLSDYCVSILRVVTCDFNLEDAEGFKRSATQEELLSNSKVLETVFRPSADNPLITNGIIKVKKATFLKSKVLASMRDDGAYLGRCDDCPDMCGLKVTA